MDSSFAWEDNKSALAWALGGGTGETGIDGGLSCSGCVCARFGVSRLFCMGSVRQIRTWHPLSILSYEYAAGMFW